MADPGSSLDFTEALFLSVFRHGPLPLVDGLGDGALVGEPLGAGAPPPDDERLDVHGPAGLDELFDFAGGLGCARRRLWTSSTASSDWPRPDGACSSYTTCSSMTSGQRTPLRVPDDGLAGRRRNVRLARVCLYGTRLDGVARLLLRALLVAGHDAERPRLVPLPDR